jgi:glycosyltransferase involved in cell wall biosynthesis
MVIAVEATRLLREVRGIGRYVRALLPRFAESSPDVRLVLFVKRERDVTALGAIVGADPRLAAQTEVRRVRELPRFAADVFWYPWNVVRPEPRHGAVVVTMHDVAPLALPDPRWHAWRKNFRWRRRFAATARSATIIVADSSFTAQEVQRMLGVSPERIRVALLAADDFSAAGPEDDPAALARLGVSAPFLLTVGAADRRKNHAQLERAMARVVATHADAMLVQAGPRQDGKPEIQPPSWNHTLGFVSESDLMALYRNAAALVMPSTYEGFGLPVLEAMQAGTPVICVRASSLPEVAADAALWIEPGDDAHLASAIGRVLSDEPLRISMRDAGLAQAARFTWDKTARATLDAFDEARRLHGSGQRPERASPWLKDPAFAPEGGNLASPVR